METQQLSAGNDTITPICAQPLVGGLDERIARIDLDMVKLKMQDADEGLGFSEAQCASAELEYKRFLHLCLVYGPGIVPNRIIDSMWHFHILDTRAYARDCQRVFGGFLHHFPYFGMRGPEDAANLKAAFDETQRRYEACFGEPMVRDEHTACWHDCENRCWHACCDLV